MITWIILFFSVLVIPIMMIVFGYLFIKKPPKKINGAYGYRTSMSIKNQELWDFAHQYFGKLWFRCGWILFMITILLMFFLTKMGEKVIDSMIVKLVILQVIALIGCIFPTERELHKRDKKNLQ